VKDAARVDEADLRIGDADDDCAVITLGNMAHQKPSADGWPRWGGWHSNRWGNRLAWPQ